MVRIRNISLAINLVALVLLFLRGGIDGPSENSPSPGGQKSGPQGHREFLESVKPHNYVNPPDPKLLQRRKYKLDPNSSRRGNIIIDENGNLKPFIADSIGLTPQSLIRVNSKLQSLIGDLKKSESDRSTTKIDESGESYIEVQPNREWTAKAKSILEDELLLNSVSTDNASLIPKLIVAEPPFDTSTALVQLTVLVDTNGGKHVSARYVWPNGLEFETSSLHLVGTPGRWDHIDFSRQ